MYTAKTCVIPVVNKASITHTLDHEYFHDLRKVTEEPPNNPPSYCIQNFDHYDDSRYELH